MTITGKVISEEVVPAKSPWGGRVAAGEVLVLTDLEGQQAVEFLCFDDDHRDDRYSSTNTLKVQGNVFVGLDTVLYSDSGKPLMTVVEDDIGRHDTIYGCCSNPNNKLRYGVVTTESCTQHGDGRGHALGDAGRGRAAASGSGGGTEAHASTEDGNGAGCDAHRQQRAQGRGQ